MRTLLLFLLITAFAQAGPNSLSEDFGWQMLLKDWGQWVSKGWAVEGGAELKRTFYENVTVNTRTLVIVKAANEPNYVRTVWKDEEIFGMKQFARFARSYRPLVPVVPPEPNLISRMGKMVEPNEPTLADILASLPVDSDPNLVKAIEGLMQ